MKEVLTEVWAVASAAAHVGGAVAVTVDAVLRKRHVSAVIGWVGLAWLAPIGGSLLYLLLGINRIQRSAVALGLRQAWESEAPDVRAGGGAVALRDTRFAGLDRLSTLVTGSPLVAGNRIEPLEDGDAAYPAMLAAIDGATRSVTLASYIFDHDSAGRAFAEALQRARERGVEVRVLIDGLGARYSRPDMIGRLRRAGVPVAAFLPTRNPLLSRYANLRNHRKIMVVDGTIGYTGGMNIRAGHCVAQRPAHPVRCLHFEVRAAGGAALPRPCALNCAVTRAQAPRAARWFAPPPPEDAGPVLARGLRDGPDADIDHIRQVLLGALAVARSRVRIVTPYFLPDEVLVAALKVKALRDVAVDLVLPARSNIRVMDWATRPQFVELADAGCRIWLTRPPFDHTKIFVVDDRWSLIGSSNWDARSLRLNFEYNLECYDEALVRRLDALVDARIAIAERLEAAALHALPLVVRLRNGLARLLSPYL